MAHEESSSTRPARSVQTPDTLTFLRQMAEALGLGGVKGVLAIQFGCDSGIPRVTITRLMTAEQQSAVVATLRQWDCELVVNGPVVDRSVSSGGAAGEPGVVTFASSHPREG